MSIYGIGVDIVEIDRMTSSLEKLGDRFAKKILYAKEFEIYQSHKQKARYLSKRFAAKEAFAKAMGTGIVEGVTLPRIEVVNDAQGKPEIKLHDATAKLFEELQLNNIFLSISDEKHYAVAQVIIEK